MKNRYHVMTSCPALSGKAREFSASYRRMALVEVSGDFEGRPAMISPRARGVVRVLRDEVHSVGKTEKSYGLRRLRELEREAAELNAA